MPPFILYVYLSIDGQNMVAQYPGQTLAACQLTYSQIQTAGWLNIITAGILNTTSGGFSAP